MPEHIGVVAPAAVEQIVAAAPVEQIIGVVAVQQIVRAAADQRRGADRVHPPFGAVREDDAFDPPRRLKKPIAHRDAVGATAVQIHLEVIAVAPQAHVLRCDTRLETQHIVRARIPVVRRDHIVSVAAPEADVQVAALAADKVIARPAVDDRSFAALVWRDYIVAAAALDEGAAVNAVVARSRVDRHPKALCIDPVVARVAIDRGMIGIHGGVIVARGAAPLHVTGEIVVVPHRAVSELKVAHGAVDVVAAEILYALEKRQNSHRGKRTAVRTAGDFCLQVPADVIGVPGLRKLPQQRHVFRPDARFEAQHVGAAAGVLAGPVKGVARLIVERADHIVAFTGAVQKHISV